MARFLLHVMLYSCGYPWMVIPEEMRYDCMESLDKANADKDIAPFAKFLARLVKASMEGRSLARPI